MYASYLDGCTRCGKCVEICTVTLVDAFDVSRSSKIVDEVVGLPDDGQMPRHGRINATGVAF